jgi:GAF domain-containing protein
MSAPLPRNEIKRIEALRRYQILDTQPEQTFDDLAMLASVICKTPIASMTLIDTDRQWFKASVGLDSTETPREHAFCAYTILGEDVMVVEDATRDERFSANPLVTSAPNIRFYAGAPLIDKEGNALGSICAIDRKPRLLDADQRAALQALARQIITQLEYRRAASQLAQALTELKTLHGLLPICAHCKVIRNDAGYWQSIEEYVTAHAEVNFSHSICPDCLKAQHPQLYGELLAAGQI